MEGHLVFNIKLKNNSSAIIIEQPLKWEIYEVKENGGRIKKDGWAKAYMTKEEVIRYTRQTAPKWDDPMPYFLMPGSYP